MEPYRILFPIGIVGALLGTAVWPFHQWMSEIVYPGEVHRRLVMGGFLHVFASGFLLTFLPRFLGTYRASPREILCQGVAAFAVITAAIFAGEKTYYGLASLQFGLIGFFLLRRWWGRTHQVSFILLLILMGIVAGLLGCVLCFAASCDWVGSHVELLGRLFFYHGAILCFLLGIGGRMVPTFMGWPITFGRTPSAASITVRFLNHSWTPKILVAFLMVSFVLEADLMIIPGRALRAIVVSMIVFPGWRLYRFPVLRTPLILSLWLAGWGLLIGLWLHAIVPWFSPHGLHFFLLMGLSLLTLSMATRVSLAHGGYGTSWEKSRWIFGVPAMLFCATLLRLFAPFQTFDYYFYLAVGACIVIAVLLGWAALFTSRWWRTVK